MHYTRIFTGIHTITPPLRDQIYTPIEIVKHPSYVYGESYDIFDLAMIVVDRTIRFSPTIHPICLPNPNDDELFSNHKALAAGECQKFFFILKWSVK